MAADPTAMSLWRRVARLGLAGWAPLALAGAITLGFFSYQAGQHSGQTVTVRHGIAHSSGYQADVESDGWTYNVPLDVSWYGGGTFHEGGTPPCLTKPAGRIPMTFGTVSYYQSGALNRLVVWVRCN